MKIHSQVARCLAVVFVVTLAGLPLVMSQTPPAPQSGRTDPGNPPADSGKGGDELDSLGTEGNAILDGILADRKHPKPPPVPAPPVAPPKEPGPKPAPVAPSSPVAPAVPVAREETVRQVVAVIDAGVTQQHAQAAARVLPGAPAAVPQPGPAPHTPPSPGRQLDLHFDSLAYRQAQTIAAQTGRFVTPGGEPPVGDVNEVRETARTAWQGGNVGASAGEAGPRGTQFFSGRIRRMNDPSPYNPVPAARTPPGRPRFREPPPPPTVTPAKRKVGGVRMLFDPAALELASRRVPMLHEVEDRLLSARDPEQIDRALAWVDDWVNDALKANGATSPLENVTVVSLRRLCAAARPYRGRWQDLPEELRHPGPLRRVHGLMIDPDGPDVLLLGAGDGAGEPIDIDDLVLGVRAVWRDRQTPVCSLDPEPWKMGGPQRSVIAGVDGSSHFARVMLDADYAMKRTFFGEPGTAVAGFQDLKEAFRAGSQGRAGATAPPLELTARFWFTPVPPGPGEVRLSPDGRLALFNARVQVLTEDMLNQGSGLAGTGGCSPAARAVARGFTRQFGAFQERVPVFRQLQGLFDITLAATLLRRLDAPAPVLGELAGLPTRRSDVPEMYPGLRVTFPTQGGRSALLQGGVQMAAAVGSRALVRLRDPGVKRFRERLENWDEVACRVDQAGLAVAAGTGDVDSTAGKAPLGGSRPQGSLEALDDRIADDPDNPEYRKQRSRAYARMGFYRLADRELLAAASLDPQDPTVPLGQLQLRIERGDLVDPASLPAGHAAGLTELFFAEAVLRDGTGAREAALQAIDRALRFSPDRVDLVLYRAALLMTARGSAEALAYLTGAIGRLPPNAGFYLARAQVQGHVQHWAEAAADASRALALSPDLGRALLLRAVAFLSLEPPDTRRAYADLRRIQELDPDQPMALVVRATLLRIEGDHDGALAAAERAVRVCPSLPEARFARALVYGETVLPGNDPKSPLAVRDPAEAAQMFQDLNMVLLCQKANGQARLLRSQLALAYLARIGNSDVDWPKILPLLTEVVGASRHGKRQLGSLREPKTPDEALECRRQFVAALLDAILDDLEAAGPAVPEATRAEVRAQEDYLRSHRGKILEELK